MNGRLVPLDTKLENGDTVEVLTSKSESAGPSRDWLSFTKSPKARNKIRQWFSKERRTEAIEEGRDELTRAMRKRNLPIATLLTPEALVGVADELNLANAEAVFVAIGEGQISTQNVISHLVRDAGSDEVNEEVEQEALPLKQVERTKKTTSSLGISVKGVGDIWVKLARCCMPVPGDNIIGFITRNQACPCIAWTARTCWTCRSVSRNVWLTCSGRVPRACSWSRFRWRRSIARIC